MRGIYVIICWANYVVYVGSSMKIGDRLNQHRTRLGNGHHENPRLQNTWNKYGEAAFGMGTYKEMPRATRQQLIDAEVKLWELWEGNRFNLIKPVLPPSMLGKRHSAETKIKIGKAHQGRTIPLEQRAKISATLKGRPNGHQGKKHSSEAKAKMSAAAQRRKHSPETRAKISVAAKKHRHSDATKARIGLAHKGMKRSFEARANMQMAQLRWHAERKAS